MCVNIWKNKQRFVLSTNFLVFFFSFFLSCWVTNSLKKKWIDSNLANQYSIESNQMSTWNVSMFCVWRRSQTSLNENNACVSFWAAKKHQQRRHSFSHENGKIPHKMYDSDFYAVFNEKFRQRFQITKEKKNFTQWRHIQGLGERKMQIERDIARFKLFVSCAPVDWNHKSFGRIQIAS